MALTQSMSDVAALGCVVCRNQGYTGSPAELHHITTGAGMGQKASDEDVIPLCPTHHRLGGWGIALHAGEREWQDRYGNQLDLLSQTGRDLIKFRELIVGRAVC